MADMLPTDYDVDVCVAKIGKPFHMRECGRPGRYLTAEKARESSVGIYSGWYHQDPADDAGHGCVPKRMIW